jgi:hypothetical protein
MEEVFDMLCGGVIPCDDYTRDDWARTAPR